MINMFAWSFLAGAALGMTDGISKSQHWRWLLR